MATTDQNSLVGIPQSDAQIVRAGADTLDNQTSPQVTSPKTAASANPTPSSPPVAAAAGSSGKTIEQLIATYTQPNPLNQFYQSTYHFRLFMMPDKDIITATGAKSADGLYSGINNIRQVTIAESGVTGYNIRDVSLTMKGPGNIENRQTPLSSVVMTITEPNGISFLDGLFDGGQELGIKNYTKSPYYLELKFLGYDENGKIASSATTVNGQTLNGFGNSGRWIWSLTPNDIDVKLNEGGAVYTLKFTCTNSDYLAEDWDIIRVPAPLVAKGKTLGEMLKDYINNLNATWKSRYNGGVMIHFEDIQIMKLSEFFSNVPAGLDDPSQYTMTGKRVETEPTRTWNFEDSTYTAYVNTGYTIPDFLKDAVLHTPQGQRLAKDVSLVTQINQSDSQVNDKRYRTPILWTVESDITTPQFDTVSNNYIRNIRFYLVPRYVPAPTQSPTEVENLKNPEVQRASIEDMITKGFLRKRYDYIFTGLNTEVIEFDMGFNMSFQTIMGNYDGALMRYDAYHWNQRWNPEFQKGEGNKGEVREDRVKPINTGDNSAAQVGPRAPAPQQTPSRVPGGGALLPQVQSPNGTALNVPINNSYIEDTFITAPGATFAVPIQFWQGNNQIINETSQSTMGSPHRGEELASTIWQSVGRGGFAPASYQNVKLTIRGDPFWLGQSNLVRQVNLINRTNLVMATSSMHDGGASGAQNVYLHFRYPFLTGNDFKPQLRPSLTFNGIYTVTDIVSTFSDGQFKQVLTCTRINAWDPRIWSTSTANSAVSQTNGGASSSAQMTQPSSTSPSPTLSNTPIAGSTFSPEVTAALNNASQKTGVPPGLMYAIAQQESSGNPNAVNTQSGATGLTQILASTGAQPGYGVTPISPDQRTDPNANALFSAQYIQALAVRNANADGSPNYAYAVNQFSGGGYQLSTLQTQKKTAQFFQNSTATASTTGQDGVS